MHESGDPFIVHELKEPGSMIIFKSYIRHTVTPVKKGTRKSFAEVISSELLNCIFYSIYKD